MPKFLTIFLCHSSELELKYLETYLGALREWNSDGIEETEIFLISQRKSNYDVREILHRQPFPVELVIPDMEWIEGYPIWDILASVRPVWSRISGRYVSFNHPEYIWGPGRLRKSIDWLKQERPYYGMGNLRRPGLPKDILAQKTPDHAIRSVSDKLIVTIRTDGWQAGAEYFETMPTTWWTFWHPEQTPGPSSYQEDVFFADIEWLNVLRFTEHGGELPFQDVYDLVRKAEYEILARYKLNPPCYRMPMDANKMIHLWHPKTWNSWTRGVRDWFLSDPVRWKDTNFLDRKIWNNLITFRLRMPKMGHPMNHLRNSNGGTVIRWGAGLKAYLESGGKEKLVQFYAMNGLDKRTGDVYV